MNRPSTPELSLYRLTQEIESVPQSSMVGVATFKAAIATFIDLLIEKQISATLWVKLPQKKYWLEEIERYQRQGTPQQIYLCSSRLVDSYTLDPAIIPIILETGSQLKREYCLLIFSAEICSAIVAQREENSSDRTQSSHREPSSLLKMVYSFDPLVINQVLSGIKQGIAITDTTPAELLSAPQIPLTSSPNIDLLNDLLIKQIQTINSVSSTPNSFDSLVSNLDSFRESLNFKDRFLDNLTREIRLPLTNMKTALSLLESPNLKREQRERYVSLLQREWNRQNTLLASVLEFIQCDRTSESALKSSIELGDLIPGIVSTYQPIAEEKGIALGYTIATGLPSISCPSNWLRQILLHLLSNSLKFTSANGRVHVKTALEDRYVRLSVSDTGSGIERSELPRIFESFYRGRNATNSDEMGAGLGLTLVKYLLDRSGGSISVESQLGKGSLFKVLLPIA